MSGDTSRIRILAVDDDSVVCQGSASLVAVRSYMMASRGSLLLRYCRPGTTIATILGLGLACLSFLPSPAYALDPNKRVTQYIHTSWRIQDGSAPDGMFSIAQTSDGFLWFTSASQGIYRFDGVRLLPWTLNVDGKTVDHVVSFHADHAGGLWALGRHEVFHQKGGVVTSHFRWKRNRRTENVSVDPDGSLWVMCDRVPKHLSRFAMLQTKT